MTTQWRVGPGGAYGLDYDTALNLMPRLGISKEDEIDTLDAISVMESAALEQMRANRKQSQ